MQPNDYAALSEALTGWAAQADGVLGLVLVGSTADGARSPDAWSDHDFFVVAAPEAAEQLRASSAWLPPRGTRIVLHERDTEHGAWVVFDDGHLLEYAVFTPDELALARADAYRIAVDRIGGLESRLRHSLEPPRRDAHTIATRLHRALLVGGGRGARGERLAARRHLLDAAGALLELAAALPASGTDADALGPRDPHDPWRRAEAAQPAIAAELEAALARSDLAAAVAIADLAARVAGSAPWWPASLATAVRDRLAAGL